MGLLDPVGDRDKDWRSAYESGSPHPRSASQLMPDVRAVLALGLTATAIAIGVVLSGSPVTVAGTNSVVAHEAAGETTGGVRDCQASGEIPAGTTAIRISLSANEGPSVNVTVLAGGRVLARGTHPAGWGVDQTVTVPVGRIGHAVSNGLVCTEVGRTGEPFQVNGTPITSPSSTSKGIAGVSLRLEYLRPARRSWPSWAGSIARHIGWGRAWPGAWIAFLLCALAVATTATVAVGLAREARPDRWRMRRAWGRSWRPLGRSWGPSRRLSKPLSRIPRGALVCGLVALLNAIGWSILTPAFEAPDEPSHFAYVQELAHAHRVPPTGSPSYSRAETVALLDLRVGTVRWSPERHGIESAVEQQSLERDLTRGLSSRGAGPVGVAASQPPLYYALELAPYALGSVGSLLDQLALMRLVSAIMGALCAMFVFMFVREALPSSPWAWMAGGLSAAVAPLLGFISGVVNPDAMLLAVSAASFYALAWAYRRGLTRRSALAIGSLVALGSLTKLNFIGLVPGLMLGLTILTVRASRTEGRRAFGWLAYAVAVAATPVCVYVLINLLTGHAGLGIVSPALRSTTDAGPILREMGYIWQFYLPRLPGMSHHYFQGIPTTRVWFDRSVGLYGWLDTSFPPWVDDLALLPAALIVALCLRGILISGGALRDRLDELLVYGVMGLGLMALVGADSYLAGGGYVEPRYLMPLLPLLGAILALAARGAGRRLGPAVGTLIVTLFLAHDLASQLLVIARFYS